MAANGRRHPQSLGNPANGRRLSTAPTRPFLLGLYTRPRIHSCRSLDQQVTEQLSSLRSDGVLAGAHDHRNRCSRSPEYALIMSSLRSPRTAMVSALGWRSSLSSLVRPQAVHSQSGSPPRACTDRAATVPARSAFGAMLGRAGDRGPDGPGPRPPPSPLPPSGPCRCRCSCSACGDRPSRHPCDRLRQSGRGPAVLAYSPPGTAWAASFSALKRIAMRIRVRGLGWS